MKLRKPIIGVVASLALVGSVAATTVHAAPTAGRYTVSVTNDGCGANPSSRCYPGGNVNIFQFVGSNTDDAVAKIGLPFPVFVYGKSYTTAWVSSNGNIQFGVNSGTAQDTYTNEPLPSSQLSVKAAVAPFWDDLYFTVGVSPAQGVYTRTVSNVADHEFVVSWRGTECCSSSAPPVRAEVIFYQDSKTITFQYVQVADNGDSATIGLQKSPSSAFEWSYNNSGAVEQNTELNFNWS